MYIGNTQSTLAASYTTYTSKDNSTTAEKGAAATARSGGSDTVTISDEARRAADAAQTEARDGGASNNPLATYATPDWMVPYGVVVPNEVGASANWLAESHPKLAAASQTDRTD
ncbi:hypothetical protein, partial [Endothiovibrio diazotrophicus]